MRTARAISLTLVVLMVVAAGCGGSSKTAATTTTKPATTTTVDPTKPVVEVYAKFFSPGATDEERLGLLEDGEKVRALYTKARNDPGTGPLLAKLSVRVDKVTVTSSTEVEVKYALLIDGVTVTQGTVLGRAKLIGGKWLVANSTLCTLLALSDPSVNADPACKVS